MLATESANTSTATPTPSTAVGDAQPSSSTPSRASSEQIRDDPSPSLPKVTVQLGSKTREVAEAAWAAVQAQWTVAEIGVSCIPNAATRLTAVEVKELGEWLGLPKQGSDAMFVLPPPCLNRAPSDLRAGDSPVTAVTALIGREGFALGRPRDGWHEPKTVAQSRWSAC